MRFTVAQENATKSYDLNFEYITTHSGVYESEKYPKELHVCVISPHAINRGSESGKKAVFRLFEHDGKWSQGDVLLDNPEHYRYVKWRKSNQSVTISND